MKFQDDADALMAVAETDGVVDGRMLTIAWASAMIPLVDLLSGTDCAVCDGVNAAAARVLVRLADTAETAADIVEAGAVFPLVELLGAGCDDVKEAAACALVKIACAADENKACIVHAGAMYPLFETLVRECGEEGVKKAAANLLEVLANCGDENAAANLRAVD